MWETRPPALPFVSVGPTALHGTDFTANIRCVPCMAASVFLQVCIQICTVDIVAKAFPIHPRQRNFCVSLWSTVLPYTPILHFSWLIKNWPWIQSPAANPRGQRGMVRTIPKLGLPSQCVQNLVASYSFCPFLCFSCSILHTNQTAELIVLLPFPETGE